MNRGSISNFLRKTRLLHVADYFRFYYQKIKNRKINNDFRRNNKGVVLPPDYLLYESFMLNYADYFYGGEKTAIWLKNHFSKHIELRNKKILDWGCGPGRIIRHLPAIIQNDCEYYATDYNAASINWCKMNLNGINFNLNSLDAQLPFPDNCFDVIYGISIFTHLSEQLHYDWYKELYRVLNNNGILFLTTHGESFKGKLTTAEIKRFNNDELIVRGNVKEGHRIFTAFHPPLFMQKLFSNVTILNHITTETEDDELVQDVWIIRKT